MVSSEIKQVLYGLKRPGERIGDVIERVIQDRKRDKFIEFLDKRAQEAHYVPIESDPEMAHMIQG
jgi:predicted CopG family antitoxin